MGIMTNAGKDYDYNHTIFHGLKCVRCPKCKCIQAFPHHYTTMGDDEKSHYECNKCGKKFWRKYWRKYKA